jgi:hypothetical protein
MRYLPGKTLLLLPALAGLLLVTGCGSGNQAGYLSGGSTATNPAPVPTPATSDACRGQNPDPSYQQGCQQGAADAAKAATAARAAAGYQQGSNPYVPPDPRFTASCATLRGTVGGSAEAANGTGGFTCEVPNGAPGFDMAAINQDGTINQGQLALDRQICDAASGVFDPASGACK